MVNISSWGRLGKWEHEVDTLTSRGEAARQIRANKLGLAYGMGRSYGDVCLNPDGILWRMTGLDHFISLDEKTGRLICEAGLLLRDIQRLIIPLGWILPVTPGTQLVTVGGAIANDVHGKSHHVHGAFGDHVKCLTLLRTDGELIECGPELKPDWFSATVGGLGLTGVILTVEIQLRHVAGPWLDTETIPYSNLDEFFQLTNESDTDWEHSVSWIDCISSGRGIFMRGNHADKIDKKEFSKKYALSVPIVPPISMINSLSLRLFNIAYFNLNNRRSGREITHYESFFYPLDNIHEWNRIYGPKGFYQYQSVVPKSHGKETVQAMLNEIAKSGDGSFLAVLKNFGDRNSVGMMSFPQSGVTLALDFPNRGAKTLKLFERLDAIVREAKGRLYMAKDARMPRDLFEAGYPKLSEFLQYRDPGISSGLSRRLMGY